MDAETQPQDPAFAAYMRDVARHPLLSPAQERELGRELMDLRQNYWRQVLSYAPFAAAALDVIAEQLDAPDALEASSTALRRAARAARDSNRKAAVDGFAAALADAGSRLAMVDAECIGADRIAADLEQLAAGEQRGVSMQIRPPRVGSKPFLAYVQRVRRAAAALRGARNRFARANLRLVVRIAARFQRTALSLHDRVQEGNIGLMKAVDRFDPSRGFRFSTYASWWIKHAIRRAVANRGRTVRLPAHLQATASKVNQTRVALRGRLKREPTNAEVAAESGLALEKIEAALTALRQRQISLEARVSDGDDRSVVETLFDAEAISADDHLAAAAETGRVRGQLLHLAPMEQDILRQRFGLDGAAPRTLTEIGQQYSLSRERIRQLQQKALRRLRARME